MVILLMVTALVAVVTGCRDEVRYDARLTVTDSLLTSNPDSALALVEALTRDSLTTDGDRAYRDLLLTQARYKCYITATSDSDINRALAYYRAHDGVIATVLSSPHPTTMCMRATSLITNP